MLEKPPTSYRFSVSPDGRWMLNRQMNWRTTSAGRELPVVTSPSTGVLVAVVFVQVTEVELLSASECVFRRCHRG